MKTTRFLILALVVLLSAGLVATALAGAGSASTRAQSQGPPRPDGPKPGTNPYQEQLQYRQPSLGEVADLQSLRPTAIASPGYIVFPSFAFLPIPDNAYIGVDDGNDGFGPDAGMVCDVINTAPVLPPGTSTVLDVAVDLGLLHTWIGDLTVKLQSPQGTILALMERIQGDSASNNIGDNGTTSPVGDSTNITYTFPVHFNDVYTTDSEAMGLGLAGGDYVCQADGICDFFPNPDQALVVGSSVASFADFAGEDPAGTWTLCVGDGAGLDVGTFANWTLNLETGVNLSTSSKQAPEVVSPGDTIQYTITLRNTGAQTLTGATLTDMIPAGTTYLSGSLSCNSGTCWFDPGTDTINWNGDVSGQTAGGQVLETYTNTWMPVSTIGLAYNSDQDLLRYAHESEPMTTVFDIDEDAPHGVLNAIQLSTVNPGWPVSLDNRDGAAYDPQTGHYFMPDFNGDLAIRDDNIIEVDANGVILNAWETDGAGNDSWDLSAINQIIDMAVTPDLMFGGNRYFAAAAGDGSTVYEIGLVQAGQFITGTWGTFNTCSVPGLSDNLGIDYDEDHGVLYHSDFNSNLIVATDLNCNVQQTFVCSGPTGFNTGVTYVEGSNPETVLVTDFLGNTTTRCTTGIEAATIMFAVQTQAKGVVDNVAMVDAPALSGPFPLPARTLVTSPCDVPGNPVTNCSFETGNFTGWVPMDLPGPFYPMTVTTAGFTSWPGFFLSSPPDGAFAMINGFDGFSGTIQLAQDLYLPHGSTMLEFDYRAAWDLVTFAPTTTVDRQFDVNIEPPGGGPPLQATTILTAPAFTTVNDTGHMHGVVDVSAFANSSVRINFVWVIPQDFTGPAFFQLDNVLVTVDPAALAVNPPAASASQLPDEVTTGTLTLSNQGGAALDWQVFEETALIASDQQPEGVPQRLGGRSPGSRPTAPQAPQTDVILDGSFEAGTPNPVWSEASTNFGTPFCTIPTCGTGTGTGPRTGDWWAWFGGIGAYEEGSASQDVILTEGSATLSFYLEQIVCDSPADYLEVLVDGSQVFLTDGSSPLCGMLGYTLQTVDLSAFADGGVHTIEFHSEIFANNAGVSNFFVDDVTLDLTCSPISDLPWLVVNPTAGTIPGGGTAVVDLTYDSTGLAPGDYMGNLCFENTDLANPTLIVPVNLTVETWKLYLPHSPRVSSP